MGTGVLPFAGAPWAVIRATATATHPVGSEMVSADEWAHCGDYILAVEKKECLLVLTEAGLGGTDDKKEDSKADAGRDVQPGRLGEGRRKDREKERAGEGRREEGKE